MAQTAANQNAATEDDPKAEADLKTANLKTEAEPTALTLVDGQAAPLSLKALHTALTERGVDMPYSSLAQFVALGDIADQIGVGGKGNRREFPRWSVDFLADFLAWYTTAGIKKELAPDAMRHRLKQFLSSNNSITEVSASKILGSENSITKSGSVERELFDEAQLSAAPGQLGFATRLLSGVLAPITAVLQDLTGAIQGLRSERAALPAPAPPPDRLLTAEQAATLLACKPRSVGRHVLPVSESPRRYRESDVLRHIAALTPIEKTGK